MRRFIPMLALPLVAATSFICSEIRVVSEGAEQAKAAVTEGQDLEKISKAFGHMIGQNLTSLGLDFDMKSVMQGIQDCMNGFPSPMTEAECIQAISVIQDNAFQKQSQENLRKAEEFLASNKSAAGVVEVDPGKLQYVILQTGSGKVVETDSSPVIRYSGKFVDGKVFGESREDEVITLNETIEGFKKGIVGMKEGEKRRIFIHPDFGYGTTGFLPPNALLAFDIEVVKANAPKTETATTSAATENPTSG